MNNHHSARDSNSISVWQVSTPASQLAINKFGPEIIYDTLIVGGGITGITTALLLQQSGQKCILAEGQTIGFGTTGGTTAHLNTFFDATYPQIEKDFGADNARLVADAGKEAFSIITGFIEQYKIECDLEYKDAFLFSETDKEKKQLEQIMEVSRRAGVDVAEAHENGVPLSFKLAALFTGQGQFHPLKYIYKLAEEFVKIGGIILENTFIRKTAYQEDFYIADSDHVSIKARNLVYATHIPPGINVLHFRCAPYRSYVLGVKLQDENYPACLSYDMQEPYHYFRTHVINGQKYLILGGEDHKTGHEDPEKAFENLEQYAKKHYKVKAIDYKWSAQFYVPADGLPYIGPLPGGEDNTFVATGFNGDGMMFGTISGKIISDLILRKESRYAALFSPSRIKPVAGFTEFVKENADVAYHFIADRFSAEDIGSLKELAIGQGMLVKFKDQKLAVYKNHQGAISALSPVCTHAGCIVNFNQAEKSWDCPCHGGRYDLDGKVLTGPPRKDLQKINIS